MLSEIWPVFVNCRWHWMWEMITQCGSHRFSDICSHFKMKKGQLMPQCIKSNFTCYTFTKKIQKWYLDSAVNTSDTYSKLNMFNYRYVWLLPWNTKRTILHHVLVVFPPSNYSDCRLQLLSLQKRTQNHHKSILNVLCMTRCDSHCVCTKFHIFWSQMIYDSFVWQTNMYAVNRCDQIIVKWIKLFTEKTHECEKEK